MNLPWLGFICFGFIPIFTYAQGTASPVAESPACAITEIRVLTGSPGGGGAIWTKLLTDVQVTPAWLDGVQISVQALVGDGSKEKPFMVLAGTARHINLPQGKQTSVLYISPNTTRRFGAVTAVHADLFFNDRVVSSLDWSGKGVKPPGNWMAIYDRKEGALLPITATPWVSVEYDKYPDILGR